jgi:Domain of unknown function (DUF4157)
MERLNQSLVQASRPVLNEPPSAVRRGHGLVAQPPSDLAATSPEARLLEQAGQSSPRILGERARSELAGSLGLDAGQIRFYDNAAADELNRRLGSDALSAGRQVLFRQGRFEPGDPRGLALIGHELTHVDSGRAGHPRQPAPDPASRAEERAAVANELRVLRDAGVWARPTARVEATPAAEGYSTTPPAGVKLAATGRLEDVSPEQDQPGLSEQQLAELRERLYRDLIECIRIDQERGA